MHSQTSDMRTVGVLWRLVLEPYHYTTTPPLPFSPHYITLPLSGCAGLLPCMLVVDLMVRLDFTIALATLNSARSPHASLLRVLKQAELGL